MKKHCLIILLLFSFLFSNDSNELIDSEMKIEKNFEEKIINILTTVLGKGKAIVTVEVKLDITKAEIYKEKWTGKKEESKVDKKPKQNLIFPGETVDTEEKPFLPGIPMKKTAEKTASTEQPVEEKKEGEKIIETITKSPEAFIKKIIIHLTIDESIEETLIEKVKTIIVGAIGLNYSRGDKIIINKFQFNPSNEKTIAKVNLPKEEISGKNMFTAYIIKYGILGLIILFLLLLFFNLVKGVLDKFGSILGRKESKASIKIEKTSSDEEKKEEKKEKEEELPEVPDEEKKEEKKLPFDFITKENINKLFYLMEGESIDSIAIIMSYLKRELASCLFSLLPQEVCREVILKMSKIMLTPPKILEDLEVRIKQRIDFLTGGMTQIIEILNFADRDTEQSILNALEKDNPELAKEIKKQLFTFEEMVELDRKTLRNILQEVKIKDLAIALFSYPDNFRKMIIANLSEGAVKMLEEENKFLPPEVQIQAKEKQQEIVRLIRQMQKEGKIIIKKIVKP